MNIVDFVKNSVSRSLGKYLELHPDTSVDQTYDGTSANAQSGEAVKQAIDALHTEIYSTEPQFMTLNWKQSSLDITFPSCTVDAPNHGSSPTLTFTIDEEKASKYKIVGMSSYELYDPDGNRINFMPVCIFTTGGETILNLRGCVMGPDSKAIKRINAQVLLEHR